MKLIVTLADFCFRRIREVQSVTVEEDVINGVRSSFTTRRGHLGMVPGKDSEGAAELSYLM